VVLNGVIMGHDFEWIRTALELFPSLRMSEAVVLFLGVGPWDAPAPWEGPKLLGGP
jgi:hypothetical protein